MSDDVDLLEPEDEEHLERVAEVRRYAPPFPSHLLTTDPLWIRNIIQAAKKRVRDRTIPPHPVPEVPAHAVEREALSAKAAKTLGKQLESQGWTVEYLAARGSAPGSWVRLDPDDEDTTWTVRVVDVAVVRALKGTDRLVATWEDGKSRSAFWNLLPVSITELKKLAAGQRTEAAEVAEWLEKSA